MMPLRKTNPPSEAVQFHRNTPLTFRIRWITVCFGSLAIFWITTTPIPLLLPIFKTYRVSSFRGDFFVFGFPAFRGSPFHISVKNKTAIVEKTKAARGLIRTL